MRDERDTKVTDPSLGLVARQVADAFERMEQRVDEISRRLDEQKAMNQLLIDKLLSQYVNGWDEDEPTNPSRAAHSSAPMYLGPDEPWRGE